MVRYHPNKEVVRGESEMNPETDGEIEAEGESEGEPQRVR